MYYKRNKKPFLIAAAVFVAVLLFTAAFPFFISKVRGEEPKEEKEVFEEQPEQHFDAEGTQYENRVDDAVNQKDTTYKLVVCSSDKGTVDVQTGEILEISGANTTYGILEDAEVCLKVCPSGENQLQEALILDGNADKIPCSIKEDRQGVVDVRFTMPADSVFASLHFGGEFPEEADADDNLRYGIALEGVNDGLKTSYGGEFNTVHFVNSLGEFLASDVSVPEYAEVTKATFIQRNYDAQEEMQEGHIYQYLCLNEDDEWLILSDYDKASGKYVFRDIRKEKQDKESAERESERIAREEAANEAARKAAIDAAEQASETEELTGTEEQQTTEGIGQETEPEEDRNTEVGISDESPANVQDSVQEAEPESSIQITGIPEKFLSYTGNDETAFCRKVYDYVLQSGLTGELKGKFKDYSIKKKKKECTFSISFGGGNEVNGTYKKISGKYSFKGL